MDRAESLSSRQGGQWDLMDTTTLVSSVSFRGRRARVRGELGLNQWPAGAPKPLEFLVRGSLWEGQVLTQGWESSEIPASPTRVHPHLHSSSLYCPAPTLSFQSPWVATTKSHILGSIASTSHTGQKSKIRVLAAR